MKDLTVPSKRSRAPSFADTHSKSDNSAFVFAAADWFPSAKVSGHVHVDNFLQECRFCKKKLCHAEDVFMYGYFGAFCSKECRGKQMAFDIFCESAGEMVKATKKGRMCVTKSKESNKDDEEEEALGNRERITSPPQFYI